jgi:hypothetical protein
MGYWLEEAAAGSGRERGDGDERDGGDAFQHAPRLWGSMALATKFLAV